MTVQRHSVVCLLIAFLWAGSAFAQSKLADAFAGFRKTRDEGVLRSDVNRAVDSGVDLRAEIPFLANIVARSSDATEQRLAGATICLLAALHQSEGDVFRPAVAAIEGRLTAGLEANEFADELVLLHALLGLQPDSETLELIYRMTSDKRVRLQGIALGALARLKPVPEEAKDIFRSRLTKQPDKASGQEALEAMEPALWDSDILRMVSGAAEGPNSAEQRTAIRILARMNWLPPQVVELLRRVQARGDLDPMLADTIRVALDRASGTAPGKDR